jgi:arylsulfatase A-like enzyme
MPFSVHRRFFLWPGLLLPGILCLGCGGPAPLTVDMPLHLEDHLDVVTIVGSEVPAEVLAPVEWHFDEPQPDWKPVVLRPIGPIDMTSTEDALRLTLTESQRIPGRSDGLMWGAIYIDLPDYRLADWGTILVRARTSGPAADLGVMFNLEERPGSRFGFRFAASPRQTDLAPVISDGSVHTYALRADWLFTGGGGYAWSRDWEQPWQQLIIRFRAREPASIDLLSVSIIPTEANYAAAPVGVRTEAQNQTHRRTLYTHAPGRIAYRVRVPEGGRLDVGLGVLRGDAPVRFRITAEPGGGETEILLEETHADQEQWAQRSVDLSHLAGRTITLALEADAERAGTVALWAAPTLSGARVSQKPNIIFYVIDGAGADHMSVYGYNRRTTPNLERLAAEGAVFEHVYSNSTQTSVSTPSFMTSLHTSVMGGYPSRGDLMLPEQEVTMAHHLHRAGFQTAVFTSNVSAGTETGLERGVDVLRDEGVDDNIASSMELHDDYWNWREAYPGEPYWVHFQTTDVHRPWRPAAPFSGLFLSPEMRQQHEQWTSQLEDVGDRRWLVYPDSAYQKTGIDKAEFYDAARSLYDETMAQQDYQLGRLVARLKAQGEWERTLLIVAADHSHLHAGLGALDPSWPRWGPMLRPAITRIPLIVVWPGHIASGQRFTQPVSMIDMLPTILDLADLPMPEVMQGQSLAPLLLGEDGWESRPVILDEFWIDGETGELKGQIEVVDGRWGASLEINPNPEEQLKWLLMRGSLERRPVPLLLYDLWNDPLTLHSLHEERPDLVEKYTTFLEAQFEAHQSLAQLFTRSEPVALTPEQLRTLRALGYIQ